MPICRRPQVRTLSYGTRCNVTLITLHPTRLFRRFRCIFQVPVAPHLLHPLSVGENLLVEHRSHFERTQLRSRASQPASHSHDVFPPSIRLRSTPTGSV